ncbi:SIR2 family protein [Chitinophaga defluvii]|uniref:SIR2 family protein n=1 Tax=Chitinophaga defluvii TaxID=3163343 RepID=A0ABV2TAY5_9BACT
MTDQDESIYRSLLKGISTGECALILGPLFGVTQDGKKIHEMLRHTLQQDYKVDLDTDFDNLFIVRKYPDAVFEFQLRGAIQEFYADIQPQVHKVYDDLVQINFHAIVSFTQDEFLKDAFKRAQSQKVFQYFSVKGTAAENTPPANNAGATLGARKKGPPILYNLYGRCNDPDSLIVGYDTFYEFLFSFIGEKQQQQLREMSERLKDSKMFLFLGFNLKKWYVPLLLTMLLKRQSSIRIPAIATMDDTDEQSNQNYMEWLSRYPMAMSFVDGTSIELIEKIIAAGKKEQEHLSADAGDNANGQPGRPQNGSTAVRKSLLRQEDHQVVPPISINEAYNQVINASSAEALLKTMQRLFESLENRNISKETNRALIDIIGALSALRREIIEGLPSEEASFRLRKLRMQIIELFESILA